MSDDEDLQDYTSYVQFLKGNFPAWEDRLKKTLTELQESGLRNQDVVVLQVERTRLRSESPVDETIPRRCQETSIETTPFNLVAIPVLLATCRQKMDTSKESRNRKILGVSLLQRKTSCTAHHTIRPMASPPSFYPEMRTRSIRFVHQAMWT